MFDKKKNFKCKECGMQFTEFIRLERHVKAAPHQNTKGSDRNGIERTDEKILPSIVDITINC